MYKELLKLKEEAQTELLYAKAKIEVVESLMEKFNQIDVVPAGEENEEEIVSPEQDEVVGL